MSTLSKLVAADAVKTFPSLDLVPPSQRVLQVISGKEDKTIKKRPKSKEGSNIFPGLLKTSKPFTTNDRRQGKDADQTYVGFSASGLKLDSSHPTPLTQTFEFIGNISSFNTNNQTQDTLKKVNLNNQANISTEGAPPSRAKTPGGSLMETSAKTGHVDPVLDELRNYATLMDKYSLHNFIIYEGQTLKDTPEFVSFKRMYIHEWGAISMIIKELEDILTHHEVKLAIINGPMLYEYSALHLATIEKMDLLNCIANFEQIRAQIFSLREAGSNQASRAALKIQTLVRMFLGIRRFKRLKLRIFCATKIQSAVRLLLFRVKNIEMLKSKRSNYEENWANNYTRLAKMWQQLDSKNENNRSRLIIHIPSLSIAEYLRLEIDNMKAMQNRHIGCLHQLADPDTTILYISPSQMSAAEEAYHDRFLSLLGISTLPKRLHFIVPEMINKLPQHLQISQALLCSVAALKRIRGFARQYSKIYIVSDTVGWADKKISNYLNIPYLGPEPSIAETISSRSYVKRVFMDAFVNIPLGAHDIHTYEDLIISLTRLIACNLDILRWMIKLNYDFNNESYVLFDTKKVDLIKTLRIERDAILLDNDGNIQAWFSKPIQLNVRKRLMDLLKKELPSYCKICRRGIYTSFDKYLKHLVREGCVIEAAPIESLGFVNSLCFIDPLGNISLCGGVDVVVDDNYAEMSYIYPQTLAPKPALEGATQAIAQFLYSKWSIIGYITIKFQAMWDAMDNMPKLLALAINFGMSPTFGSLGATAISSDPKMCLPTSLIPTIPEGRFAIHLPIVTHDELRSTRDDIFFKFCRIRGISYDIKDKVGTMFFLVDSVVGGAVSILCIGSTRRKAVELATFALSFVYQQFGKNKSDEIKSWDNVAISLNALRKLLKQEDSRM